MIGRHSGQRDLADWGIEHKPGVLDEVNAALNWKRFDALLHKVFKASREGRSSYPPLVLFKVVLLQQWYGLSAPHGRGNDRRPAVLPALSGAGRARCGA